jgi:hypothetical protein
MTLIESVPLVVESSRTDSEVGMHIWRRQQRQLARELRTLRNEMEDAQRSGDIDWEYLLLCRIVDKTRERGDLGSS